MINRLTTLAVANALRKGVEANFTPANQVAELEKLSDLLIDMAASLEMTDPEDERTMKYARILSEVGGWLETHAIDVACGK
jgi:hypothetical protein